MNQEPTGLLKQDTVVKSSGDYVSLLGRIHDGTASSAEHIRYESMNRAERISLGLEATAPELFEGRLPKSQMTNYRIPDNYDYILAVNRNGVESYEQLSEFLKKNHGINTNMQDKLKAFGDRFYIPGKIGELVENGDIAYRLGKTEMLTTLDGYGSGFNFITCIPIRAATSAERSLLRRWAVLNYFGEDLASALIENGMTPSDLLITVDGKMSVNEKYIAGVVDNDGLYTPNETFLGRKPSK